MDPLADPAERAEGIAHSRLQQRSQLVRFHLHGTVGAVPLLHPEAQTVEEMLEWPSCHCC
jgi:hypothetical protein